MGRYFEDGTDIKTIRGEEMKYIGRRIKHLRTIHNDTQKELAKLCDVSGSYFSKIEKGRSDVKASIIPVLAERYNVYAETFFNEYGNISDCLIGEIINNVALNSDSNDVRDYLKRVVEQIIEGGKAEELFKMFYVSAKTCLKYEKPMDNIASEMYRAKEYDGIKDIESNVRQMK